MTNAQFIDKGEENTKLPIPTKHIFIVLYMIMHA